MENITNRNDIRQFFKDMPEQMQREVINKLNKQIKKPPDSLQKELQEVATYEESTT